MEPAQEAEEDDEGVSAVNVMQKKRMDEAKIAREYMAGGMAPQQAAWKCGFKRVDAMNEAIRELEKAEEKGGMIAGDGYASSVPSQDNGDDASAYLPSAAVAVEFGQQEQKNQPWRMNRPAEAFKPPLEKWQNDAAIIHYYGQNGSYPPMFKVMTPKNSYHIQFGVDEMKDAARLMCTAAGVKLASQAAEDLAETEEELVRESQEHTKELQRNAELAEKLEEAEKKLKEEIDRNEELKVMVKMLEARVEAMKTLSTDCWMNCSRLEAAQAEVKCLEHEMMEFKAKAFEKMLNMMN